MPQQPVVSLENNFTQGLKTEFTGLNFPENAATEADNVVFGMNGNVTRRLGIDFETNRTFTTINRSSKSMSSYIWKNAGGDGLTEVYVQQVGSTIYFFRSSTATTTDPLSDQKLGSEISLTPYLISGSNTIADKECQFADGNGYLFVFHPYCNPIFCTYASGTITAAGIDVRVRDTIGAYENVEDNNRPATLTAAHQYNLQNQGWTAGAGWETTDAASTVGVNIGRQTFSSVAAGLPVVIGSKVEISQGAITGTPTRDTGTESTANTKTVMTGSVVSYSGSTIVIYVYAQNTDYTGAGYTGGWTIRSTNAGYIDDWNTQIGVYPSNADIWWTYKDENDEFKPAVTFSSASNAIGAAPKGRYVLSAFDQNRTTASGVSSLSTVGTSSRPKTGAWFQGRVWYAGTDSSQAAGSTSAHYTWSESIYFSQIVNDQTDFGLCYQANDPTSEETFDLLATDGGSIRIQGCGAVYKLWPTQNGLLVFAANGIWFITGSQGIGFSANDYTITQISKVKCISGTSFVDVNGMPMFWNEEGIYSVESGQQGGLQVNPLTLGTILSYYQTIKRLSKNYARGDYDPINYLVKWVYKEDNESGITTRYEFDRILVFNTATKAFFHHSIAGNDPHIHDIKFVSHPGGTTAPAPTFKYFASKPTNSMSFAEELDTTYVDWRSVDSTGFNYDSYFVTGYRLKGQAQRRFQAEYVYIFSNNNTDTSYKIRGSWNYASTRNSGKFSSTQLIVNDRDYFNKLYRRHRIRGQGIVLQFQILSVVGQPFDIFGWSVLETQSTGV